jgi:hypothetical protein
MRLSRYLHVSVRSRAHGIERIRPRPEGENEKQAPGDRNVLEEVDVLHHLLVRRCSPEIVEENPCDKREDRDDERGPSGLPTYEQCDAEHELDDDGDGYAQRG